MEKVEWMEAQEEPPRALLNRPELREDLSDIWVGFSILHESRPSGFSDSPIPVSEIVAYWRWVLSADTVEEIERGVKFVKILDREFFKWREETKDKT